MFNFGVDPTQNGRMQPTYREHTSFKYRNYSLYRHVNSRDEMRVTGRGPMYFALPNAGAIRTCVLVEIIIKLFMSVQLELRREIQETVTLCSQSLFIFDEADKMPAGLLGDIQHYAKQYKHSTFIFLR